MISVHTNTRMKCPRCIYFSVITSVGVVNINIIVIVN